MDPFEAHNPTTRKDEPMRRHDIERRDARAMADAAIAAGFRAFLSASGTYGLFTDADGTRVVSFQACDMTAAGCYVTSSPIRNGTGWRLGHWDPGRVREYFDAPAPRWATEGASWRYTTLAEHLATYTASGYREITTDAEDEEDDQ